jgi:hypothetical protein
VPFFNELEVLEIRLDIMYDYVDFFYNKWMWLYKDYLSLLILRKIKIDSQNMSKIIYIKHSNTDNIDELTPSIYSSKKELYRIIDRLESMKNHQLLSMVYLIGVETIIIKS